MWLVGDNAMWGRARGKEAGHEQAEGKHRPACVHGFETVRKEMHVNSLALIKISNAIRRDCGCGGSVQGLLINIVAQTTTVNPRSNPDTYLTLN